MTDLLLSVYELSALSDEIYFNVNQKVTSIFSRIGNNNYIQYRIMHQMTEIWQEIAIRLSEVFLWSLVNVKVGNML